MARKQKQPQVPTQYKHLRFADAETGEILNFGGFTLAYRCTQQPSEVVGRPNIQVEYAYSECSINDNFNKKDGRSRTYNRLTQQAPDFYTAFDITPQLPEGYEHAIIQLSDGIVDIAHGEFNLQRAVVEHFLAEYAEILNVGTVEEGEGNLLSNLFDTEAGTLAINSEVLSYVDPSFESVANEVGSACVRIADEALDMLDSIDGVPTAEQTQALHKALTDIKDLCSSMVAASGSEDEEGEEGEDGEEDADELDTEADDGGLNDDEESDEDDEEDDEESDDEEDEEGDDEEEKS